MSGLHSSTRTAEKGQAFPVLADPFSDFADTVDIDKIWERLRKKLPPHQSWIPSESPGRSQSRYFSYPEGGQVSPDFWMAGSIYRVRRVEVGALSELKAKRLGDGLRYLSSEVSSAHAIDVSLRLDLDISQQSADIPWRDSSPVPKVWGVLFDPNNKTAYGTAGGRVGGPVPGTRNVLIRRRQLLLRFELPRLETALLGLSPESVLAGSELYLFYFEQVADAQARFAKGLK